MDAAFMFIISLDIWIHSQSLEDLGKRERPRESLESRQSTSKMAPKISALFWKNLKKNLEHLDENLQSQDNESIQRWKKTLDPLSRST